MKLTEFDRDGLTFDVSDAGPAGGELAVLLHGFPTDRSSWGRISPVLHEAGVRTLAPNQRGYSPRAVPKGRRAYAIGELVEDVLKLANAAGVSRFHLVGHDWGGGVAWATAIQHPDRVASLTVLSTPHPAAMSAAMIRGGQIRKSWYMGLFQIPWLPEQLVHANRHRMIKAIPTEDAERYLGPLHEPRDWTGRLNWYRALPLAPKLGACRVPTTFVWGNRDPYLGRAAAEATKRYVRADYSFVELAAGHWLPEKKSAECAAAILQRMGGETTSLTS